jgi:F0F1-type ATP synthase assembly protein I
MNPSPQKYSTTNANYLAASFQMAIMIFLGVYGGIQLDKITGEHFIFTVLFTLIAVALSMYNIIRKEISLNKNKHPNNKIHNKNE